MADNFRICELNLQATSLNKQELRRFNLVTSNKIQMKMRELKSSYLESSDIYFTQHVLHKCSIIW